MTSFPQQKVSVRAGKVSPLSMIPSQKKLKAMLALACAFFGGVAAQAQSTLYWDGDNAGAGGGTGTWNLSNLRWSTVNTGGPYAAWSNTAPTDHAHFQDTAGTVTIGSGVTVRSLNFNASSGTYTLSGGNQITLADGTGIIDTTTNATISSVIGGTVGLTKNGAGTLALSGTNVYSGGTIVSAGTLTLSGNQSGVSGGLTLTAGTLNLNSSTALGAGTLTINGGTLNNSSGGAVTLTSNNAQSWGSNFTFTGSSALNLGTGAVTLTANRSLTISASTLTVGGAIGGGAFTLSKAGNGTLVLNGANTYDGRTTVSAGTLTLAGDNNAAGGGVRITGGVLNLNHANAAGTGVLEINGGTIDNTSGSAKTLTGVASQSWGSSFTFTGSSNLDLGLSAVTMTNNRTLTITAGTLTVGGAIDQSSGSRTLTKAGNGTLVLNGDNLYDGRTTVSAGTLTLAGNNSGASGGVTLTTGNLNLNNANALGGGTFIINGGTLDNTSGGAITIATTAAQTWGGNFAFAGSNALNLGTGAVTLSANRTVTVTAGTLTVGGAIGGAAFTLGKAGAGTLVLNGDNTYDGRTTLTAGTLTLAGNNSGATGGVTLTTGNLNLNNANALGTGTFIINGGTLDNTSGGAITIATTGAQTWGGDFAFTGTNALNLGTGAVTLSANRIITANASNLTVGGNIGGAFSLTKAGAGILTLSGNNAYSGGTNLNAGTLALGSANAIGTTGTISFGGGTLQYSASNTTDYTSRFSSAASQAYNIDTNGQSISFGTSLVSAGGNLTKIGTGILTLTTTNSYSGGTWINTGALRLGVANALPTSTALTIGASGTFDLNNFNAQIGSLTGSGTVDNTAGGASILTVGDSNNIGFAGTLTDSGAGSLALTKTGSGIFTLSGSNSYVGGTNINQGTLALGSANAIGSSGTVSFGGGTLQYSASNTTDYSARFSNAASQAYSIDTNGQNVTFGTGLTSTGGTLTKLGTGVLRLNAANSYSGTTTVTAGTLRLGIANALNTASTLSVGASGTFDLNNFNAQVGALAGVGTIDNTAGGASILTVGDATNTSFAGTLTDSGAGSLALTKTGSGTLTLSGSNSYVGGTNINGGTLALGSAGALASAGTISFGGGTLQYSASNTTDYTARFSNAASQAYSIDTNGQNVTFGTGLTSTGGTLTKTGTGTLTLGVANSYTGITTVNGGTLSIAADNRLGTAPGSPVANSITLGGGSLTATTGFTLNSNRGVTLTAATTSNITANNSQTLTYGGAMTGSGNVTFGTASTGAGTVALTGASTNTGTVAVNAGTLNLQHSGAVGSGSAGTTVASGATLQLQGSIAAGNGTLTLAGTGVGGTGALVNVTGVNNQWTGNIAINGAATTINAGADYAQTMILGTASPTASRPFGAPPTDTNTLDLGSNTLTLTSTGTTQLRINSRIIGTGNLIVDLNNVNSVVRLNSNYNTYTGSTTVENGTLRVRTTYNSYPNDPTAGWENYFGINGPLVIGNASNGAGTAVVDLLAGTTGAEVLNFTTNVTINASGKLLNQSAQSINNLIFNGGGQVDLTTDGSLFLNGVVTVNPTAGQTATIGGTSNSFLSLTIHNGNPALTDRSFVVNGGAGNASDLTISSLINDGGFTKTGTGTMTITSNNSTGYGGQSKVNNGILNVQHSNALGQGAGLDAKGTVVGNGGTLQLQATANGDDGIAANSDDNKLTFTAANTANEKLFLNGDGFGSNGALNSKNGTNVWGGNIDLQTSSRVQTDADLLTLAGNIISSTDASLDVRGAGNTTISGAIGTGSGGLTKNGTGTLIVSGNNTFQGAATITTGIVSVQHNNGLGGTTGGTTVAGTGAALHLDNTAKGGGSNFVDVSAGETLSIAGTGVGATGALYNAAGNNIYGGQITLADTTLIAGVTGSTLTLSGGTTSSAGATKTLTVGTTGQAGDVTISGNMSNGVSYSSAVNLIKEGAGKLTFSGATGTVGTVALNAGTMDIGAGTLATSNFSSATNTTLTIASGGTVDAHYAAGSTTYFSGAMAGDGTGANGIFKMTGGNLASTLVLDKSGGFNASNLTLVLNGGTLKLTGGGDFVFNTIEITGATILDFDNSWNTSLSSTNLIITGSGSVTVKNWLHTANNAAQSTIWYATSTVGTNSSNGAPLTGTDKNGTTPLNQITFESYPGYTTTWTDQSTPHGGWFDHEIRPTPEPATYGAIFLSACFGLLGWRRWRTQNRS